MFLHFHACLHDFLILGHKIWFCYFSLLLAAVANQKSPGDFTGTKTKDFTLYCQKSLNLIIVYQKRDIVKQLMKSRDFLPKMFQEWGGVGVSCRSVVGNEGWNG